MELTDVPGVGATKAERLHEAGITSVKDLAEIDLRKKWDVGIGDEVLKRAKQAARKLCDQEGIAYAKAPYGGQAQPKKAAKPAKPDAPKAPIHTNGASEEPAAKRGWLARIFKRA